MRISVIVPVYNVERYLRRCLESLVAQEGAVDYEIICIDDCSTDGSLVILREYELLYSDKIHVIKNEENRGQGYARDLGLQVATGDYIMFVDSDDFVRRDYICTFIKAMKAEPCDIVIGSYADVSGNKISERTLPHSEWTIVGFGSACAKLFDKKFLEEHNIRFSSIRYAEDTYMSLCTFYHNARCVFIDYPGYYYCMNPASTTRSKNYDKKLEVILGELYDNFIESHPLGAIPVDRKRMIEYFYISDMLNTILVYSRGCGSKQMQEKLDFFLKDLQKKFPDYRNNPYCGLFKPKGQRLKTRIGVGMFTLADRLGQLPILFRLFA